MSRRYLVERKAEADFKGNQVYVVRRAADDVQPVTVWWRKQVQHARCASCSTCLRGMSASCPHARAVRRVALAARR